MTRSRLVPTVVLTQLCLLRIRTVTDFPKWDLGLFFWTSSFNVTLNLFPNKTIYEEINQKERHV